MLIQLSGRCTCNENMVGLFEDDPRYFDRILMSRSKRDTRSVERLAIHDRSISLNFAPQVER